MLRSERRWVVVLVVGFACLGILHSETLHRDSAWGAMVRNNPAIVDDTSVGWQDRLILSVLSREQAEAYYQGTRAEDILLDDGQTLAEYLEARLNQPGNVYVPLPVGCELFLLDEFMPGETQAVKVRGQCGIPEEATAVILQIRAELSGLGSRVKVWAADLPEPAEAVVERQGRAASDLQTVTTVATLCAGKDCTEGDLTIRSLEAATVRSEVLGYFRPVSALDGVGAGGIQFYIEGEYNSFFGTGAGTSNGVCEFSNPWTPFSCYNAFFGGGAGYFNTTGYYNAFFGSGAGRSNTSGAANTFFGTWAGYMNNAYGNAFFGHLAGYNTVAGSSNAFFGLRAGEQNTTGSGNTFVGESAGYYNTVENNNTCLGFKATLYPGFDPMNSPVTNATAIGAHSVVTQSNSLILGSIAGINDATASTQVGIGTTAPQRLLHIAGSNAVFRMDRSNDTAAFMIVRTDTSGKPLKTFVVGVNSRPAAPEGEFVINDLGPAVAGPGSRRMTINNAGNVTFTGSVTTPTLIETSSLRFKTNVRALEDPLELVRQLRGVRFNWRDSGKASVGLIAEEVAQVLPELVALEANGEASGVNYSKLVAVLVEAVKVQDGENSHQREMIRKQQERISQLEARLSEMDELMVQVAEIRAMLRSE